MAPVGFADKVAFVWKVADKLRGTFKQHEYGSVMLPLLVLRRMDAVLAPTKDAVLDQAVKIGALQSDRKTTGKSVDEGMDYLLKHVAGQRFYNLSPLTFTSMLQNDKELAEQLASYIRRLSADAYNVVEAYSFDAKIARLDRAGILYPVLADFADLDLRPTTVSNEAMGYIFEELLRKFSEMSNETAGEHYTPREVIDLMVALLLHGETSAELTANPKPVRTVYDPAAGTGGMLMGAAHGITAANPAARVQVYGQELNPETWAIAQSDLMMQDTDPGQMAFGNSLTQDAFPSERFDFILANPPYGVDWKSYAQPIKDEHANQGFHGRFGAGLPRVSDGSLLFLQHMLAKMKPSGSRVGIVLSGSPLFSGAAGSGESEIRRWILEQDYLEGIVALPDQMFYNTVISTYVWILTNDKDTDDRGLVRLVDGRELGTKMRKPLGDKRKELTPSAIGEITRLYGGARDEFADDERVRVVRREEFGFQRVTVEQPLRRRWDVTPEAVAEEPFTELAHLVGRRFDTEKALLAEVGGLSAKDSKAFAKACAIADPDAPVIMKKGKPEPDPDLRDQENIPLPERFFDIDDKSGSAVLEREAEQHLADEIHPYVPDAWIDHAKSKVGIEIPFTRQFYVYEPPRPIEEIASEIKELESQIQHWMKRLGL
ncbi:type I restriction-modification system subunit M [Brachybacterium paraconglomeratum]|uniref:type I restriction-modification system subunit M n=1 Tax=Brachybacterium paraconglomeratum TaxID=173362 RepID=UPI00223BCDE5|nr:class I SAM-dependent DNA methyltransferase [Brachybacterium paraconglomeratum]MCT1435940.1 type I restriction-modification system subunit M [Brachybacterium paraconglomeratum]